MVFATWPDEAMIYVSRDASKVLVWKPAAGQIWERTFASPSVDVTNIDTTPEFAAVGLTDLSGVIPELPEE